MTSRKTRKLVADLPKRGKGVLVISEMGWWEAHGNIVVASVKHKRGEDDEALNAKLPYGFKGLITKKSVKAHGSLDGETQVLRELCHERILKLVDKYGPVIDKHPLLWLRDLSEVLGKSVVETLDELLGK